jgi:hypothetical protein
MPRPGLSIPRVGRAARATDNTIHANRIETKVE